MKKRIPLILISFLLCAVMLMTSCGSGSGNNPSVSGSGPSVSGSGSSGSSSKDNTENADLTFSVGEASYPYSFSQSDSSGVLSVTEATMESFAARLSEIRCVFPYREYYGVEELFDRLYSFRATETHLYSALDAAGNLTPAHLTDVVRENNWAYLEAQKNAGSWLTRYTEPSDELLSRICGLITETVNAMRLRFPEIDWDRVFCNLGNLKVLHEQRVGTYLAAVDVNMVLCLQDSILSLAGALNGAHGIRNTLIHEIMHIIQYGCTCEEIENCTARLGISYIFSDVSRNALQYYWLAEGAAEKETCLLTGDPPQTYESRIWYIESLDYATFLQEDVPAYFAESIPFYGDPERLFGLLGCTTEEEKREAAVMMCALEIMQTMPEDFTDELGRHTDLDVSDSAVAEQIRAGLRSPVCLYLAKQFYRNLLQCIGKDGMTENDLYCLIRLFEGLLDRHLGLRENRTPETNDPFLTDYTGLRNAFFELLKEEGNSVSLDRYLVYDFFTAENVINAGFSWLPEEKVRFVFDRVEALGEKQLLADRTPVR